jgi:4-hydroxy-tetrahydrodipicolinate synthase
MKFRSDPAGIRGSIAPVVTPFTDDGGVDHDSLRGLIRFQLEAGSHGISLGGSTGEPSAQSVAERVAAMRTAAAEIADRVPFLPGTGSHQLDETLELTAAASQAGADAALVITPYYARPTQEGLYQWYATVDIAPETMRRLFADFDNIVGIKETTRDFEHFSRVLHACGPSLLMWSGIELLCLPLLALGGTGFVSAVANLAPGAVARMYELWQSGDFDAARDLHYRLHPLADLLFVETNPAPAKWVLKQQGRIASAHVRPPLITPTAAGIARIRTLLAEGGDLTLQI